MSKVYLVYEGFGNDWLDGNWSETEYVSGVYPSLDLATDHVRQWIKHYEGQNGSEISLEACRGKATFLEASCLSHNNEEEYYCYIEEKELSEEVKFRACF